VTYLSDCAALHGDAAAAAMDAAGLRGLPLHVPARAPPPAAGADGSARGGAGGGGSGGGGVPVLWEQLRALLQAQAAAGEGGEGGGMAGGADWEEEANAAAYVRGRPEGYGAG
jgi:hypothetical protein